jgi:ABC-type nitrate/sulfonate/bicarbonate transport system substrate-binding protein
MGLLRIGLEWFVNPDHTPFFVAREMGWLKEIGLDIELIEPTTHLDPLQEISAGKLDVAITEPLHVIADRSEGHKVIGFARFLHTVGGVMYLKGKGITRPSDMAQAGLRIQYPGAPGTCTYITPLYMHVFGASSLNRQLVAISFMITANGCLHGCWTGPGGLAIISSMIEADGGKCENNVFKTVNNGFMHTDALATDIADVATLVFANFELIEAKHRGLDVDMFALKNYGIPDFNQLILITSEDCFSNRREDIKLLVKVLHRAVLYIESNPDEARAIYTKCSGNNASAFMTDCYNATVTCFTPDFSLPDWYFESLNTWMFQKSITVYTDTVWTNELVADLPTRA